MFVVFCFAPPSYFSIFVTFLNASLSSCRFISAMFVCVCCMYKSCIIFIHIFFEKSVYYQNSNIEASNFENEVCTCRTHSVAFMSMSSFFIGCLLFFCVCQHCEFIFTIKRMKCDVKVDLCAVLLLLMSLLPMLPLLLTRKPSFAKVPTSKITWKSIPSIAHGLNKHDSS